MKIKKGKSIAAIALIVITSVATLSLVLSQMTTDWREEIPHYQDIGVDEAYAYIYSGYRTLYPAEIVVIDVDEPAEFAQKHIAGAINIPFMGGALAANLSDPSHGVLGGYEDDTIIVTCMYGCRSPMASEMLARCGEPSWFPGPPFQYVYDMLGGITMWNETAGYPAEPGANPAPSVSAQEAKIMLMGVCKILVDVRTQAEYDADHIINSTTPPILEAWNIPWVSPGTDLRNSLAPMKDDVIIVYCQSDYCPKARLACETLVANGFTKVYRMIGGIEAWKKLGYPTAPTIPTSVFTNSFEEGVFLPYWTGTRISSGETLGIVSTQYYEGANSCYAKCATSGHYAYVYKTLSSASDTLYVHMYVRFAQDLVNGGSGIALMHIASGTNNVRFNLRIRKTYGQYKLEAANYQEGKYYGSATFPIVLNQWYAVELQVHVDASAGWLKALWEGETKIDVSGKNTGTTLVQRVNVGIAYTWQANAEIYVDYVDVS